MDEKINQFLDNWTYNNANTSKESSIPKLIKKGNLEWDECDAQSTRNSGVENEVVTEVPATPIGVRPTVIEKGTRVRIKPHTFGDCQDGQEGVVVRVYTINYSGVKKNKYTVLLANKNLPQNLRSVECHATWFDVLQ